ncbi:acylneuraminate cytidylyltransferase family protein [Chromobacterium haemolyticum]|uniref:acylneuraminate cytidylyltransferase family protein n=1 Tax=Chromobacterium haemolyticum TaxID=394935 RepID=UPI0009DA1387|nr:acylneuraminate cytidylyltransferase family protein [Chromobacterium haemolyticum]OQS42505.1 flagellar modification protein B [Chromobacterium haemolyticum]
MKQICTICARGGSKGVKGKNFRLLLGKPLIAYSIEQARASDQFDVIAVSSDSEHILNVALEYGADILVKRPDELATDRAAKLPVIRHCVEEAERISGQVFDVCVDLDATSPLRSIDDIKRAVEMLKSHNGLNVITAMPARRSPYFNLIEVLNDGTPRLSKVLDQAIVRRQDAPACFDMNASIYVWTRETLFSELGLFNEGTKLYVMPEERSIDIDSENDFLFVEFLMKHTWEKSQGGKSE